MAHDLPNNRWLQIGSPRGRWETICLCSLACLVGTCWGAAGFLAPASAPTTETAPLTIGLLLPPEEATVASLRQGVELAVAHANQDAAPPVRLLIRGRPGQWGDDATEAARMVLDDEACGLIAPPSGAASHLSLQVAGRTAVPVISLCPDASVTKAGIPWMIRLVPETREEARLLFTCLRSTRPDLTTVLSATGSGAKPEQLGVKDKQTSPARWVACVPLERAGREAARDLIKVTADLGIELRNPTAAAVELTNAAFVAQQLLSFHPDAILVWLDPIPAGRLTASLRRAGFTGTLAGPSRCQGPAFLDAAGRASEGFLVAGVRRDPDCESLFARVTADYRERYQTEPDPMALMAYDAAQVLIRALRAAGPETPRAAFPLQGSWPGASGPLRFDRQGNRQCRLNLLICHQQHFAPLPL